MFAAYNPFDYQAGYYDQPSYAEQQRLARIRQLRAQQAARARAEQEYAQRQRAYAAAIRAEEERARLLARRRREYELELLRNWTRAKEEEQPSEPVQVPEPVPEPRPSQEDLDEAATKIQSFYRQQRSLRTIRSLATRFETLQSTFQLPSKIDFTTEGGVIAIDTSAPVIPPSTSDVESWKLAFTSNNVPIHAYNEELSRLLVALDGVESWGSKPVRMARRDVVSRVEREAGRVEDLIAGVWSSRNSVKTEKEELEDGVMVEVPLVDAAAAPEAEVTDKTADSDGTESPVEVPAVIEDPEDTLPSTDESEESNASEMAEVVSIVAQENQAEEETEDWMMVPLPEDS